MSPDLNSLPPSTDEAQGADRAGSQGGDTLHEPSPSHIGALSSSPSAGHDVPPARRSPRPRGSMRINLHDPASPLGGIDADPRRQSPRLYRTSSGARREGLAGSGFSSPRSPISGAITQGDPHHQRAPSLGELHQELEQEQEAQVVGCSPIIGRVKANPRQNRLLQMIRRQQAQLDQLQAQNPSGTGEGGGSGGGVVADDDAAGVAGSHADSPRSMRSRSRRSSHASPAAPVANAVPAAPRDEAAFYAVETQSLTRENRMLRVRIRELEQQVRDMELREGSESIPAAAAAEPSGHEQAQPADAAATSGLERKDDAERADTPVTSTSGTA